MLKREFKRSENIAIVVLTVLLLVLLYYQFVYRGMESAKQQYDTAEVDSEILMEQTKAAKIARMQEEIAQEKGEGSGVVETYDNLKAEINELNDIFSEADTFSFGFDQATGNGDAVRRNINAVFTASSYELAKKMLENLHDSRYRCLIRDVSVATAQNNSSSGEDGPNLNKGPVAVSFTVTFYETLYNATTTDGLLIEQPMQQTSDPSVADQIADKTAEYNALGL